MTIELHLTGPAATAVEPAAVELLRRLGGTAPERIVVAPDGERQRGGADRAIAIAGLVLALPGAIGATLELTRPQAAEQVQAVCRAADAHDIDVTLVIEGEALDLRRKPTDEIVDRLLRARGER